MMKGRITITENLKKFLEAVSKDEALTAKIGAMGKEELLALAKELGLALTADDLTQPTQELDDDLDTVAGGSDVSCACAMGGGTKTLLSYIMVCKRCAANPTHVYAETLKECPICGEKEFTYS